MADGREDIGRTLAVRVYVAEYLLNLLRARSGGIRLARVLARLELDIRKVGRDVSYVLSAARGDLEDGSGAIPLDMLLKYLQDWLLVAICGGRIEFSSVTQEEALSISRLSAFDKCWTFTAHFNYQSPIKQFCLLSQKVFEYYEPTLCSI